MNSNNFYTKIFTTLVAFLLLLTSSNLLFSQIHIADSEYKKLAAELKLFFKTGDMSKIIEAYQGKEVGAHQISVKILGSNLQELERLLTNSNGQVKSISKTAISANVTIAQVIQLLKREAVKEIHLEKSAYLAKTTNLELKHKLANLNKVKTKLSPNLQNIVTKYLLNGNVTSSFHSIYKQGNRKYASVFMEYAGDIHLLKNQGAQVGAVVNNLMTARIPLAALLNIAEMKGVKYIKIAEKAGPNLDTSVPNINADLIHKPRSAGGQGVDGEGVLIGIIDTGIDWQHPDFIDGNGTLEKTDDESRILYLWDQLDDGPPLAKSVRQYSYGTEYDAEMITNEIDGTPAGLVKENDPGGHGTHVAGICAGDSMGTMEGKYTGVAPEADIIFVKSDFGGANLLDGANYILEKAQELGRPCVINASFSGNLGPHDGSSMQSQICDQLLLQTPGLAIVNSAGNSRNDSIHVEGKLTQEEYHNVEFNVPTNINSMQIDIWYSGTPDSIDLQLSTPSGEIAHTLDYVKPLDKLTGLAAYTIASDNISIDASDYQNQYNQNAHITIMIEENDSLGALQAGLWNLNLFGRNIVNGKYDMWVHSEGGQDGSFSQLVKFKYPSSSVTIGDLGTTRQILTVGSYNTKLSWLDWSGSERGYAGDLGLCELSPFSSLGPTRDNRIKPEIVAPGLGIGSALASSYEPNSLTKVSENYVIMQGTSMSGPHVTGAIALMMQVYPFKKAATYKKWIIDNARTDEFTAGYGSEPNNYYGYGKLDLQKIFSSSSFIDDSTSRIPETMQKAAKYQLFANYPNPFNPKTTIKYSLAQPTNVKIAIYNIKGQLVDKLVNRPQPAGLHQILWNASDLPSGIYFYKLITDKYTAMKKCILLK